MTEEIVTLTFENAANENKVKKIVAPTGDLLRDYVGKAAKQLFASVPYRVGITTKDGIIVSNWSEMTIQQFLDTYDTTFIVIGTPDQLGNIEKVHLCPFFSPLM